MVLMMYWDSEDHKKRRIGEELKRKRDLRKGTIADAEIIEDPKPEPPASDASTREELAKQGDKINALQDLLLHQTNMIRQLLERKEERIEILKPSAEEVRLKEAVALPVFNEDVKVSVIDKTGIEVSGGTPGKKRSEGENISERIRKLKELKNKKE